jgi:hypothetical protein
MPLDEQGANSVACELERGDEPDRPAGGGSKRTR